MKLVIIRHAQAEGFAMDDSSRALTEKGKDQAVRVGVFLRKQGLVPDLTIVSPYKRARQTARIFCDTAGAEAPMIEPWLACGMRPSLAMEELVAYADFGTVAICGHNPDFSYLAEALLGRQTGGIHVSKASIIVFDEVRPPAQSGYLEMLLPPSVF